MWLAINSPLFSWRLVATAIVSCPKGVAPVLGLKAAEGGVVPKPNMVVERSALDTEAVVVAAELGHLFDCCGAQKLPAQERIGEPGQVKRARC
jgi:hypothetical protein